MKFQCVLGVDGVERKGQFHSVLKGNPNEVWGTNTGKRGKDLRPAAAWARVCETLQRKRETGKLVPLILYKRTRSTHTERGESGILAGWSVAAVHLPPTRKNDCLNAEGWGKRVVA